MLTRRQWLAALPVARVAALNAAETPRPLGVRLYSVRGNLHQEADKTLKAIARIGYREVEGYNRLETITLGPRIKDAGLAVRSCRTETPLITADWENYPEYKQVTLTEAIDSVAGAGVEYFLMGYIAPGARGDAEDFYRRTADRMSAAAELCRKSGLKFAWQNHAFEFEGQPGHRPVDIYKERLDQKLVGLELNVFWASVAGQDPLWLLKEWKGRVPLLQLNDKAKKANAEPHQFSENVGLGAYVEAGAGDVDFPAILKAAPAAGVKVQFVGQDETSGDPIESLRRSFAYLNRIT